jgi:hypothetical protein
VLTAYVRIANAISGDDVSLKDANRIANGLRLFARGREGNVNRLDATAGATLISELTGQQIAFISIGGTQEQLVDALQVYDESSQSYFATGRVRTTNAAGDKTYLHTLSVDDSADTIRIGRYVTVDGPQPLNDTSSADRRRLGSREAAGRKTELLRVDLFFVVPSEIER